MTTTTISKQFIMDNQGRQLGVILPIDDYLRVEPILQQYVRGSRDASSETDEKKLLLIEQAASDPLFLADLREAMNDFKHVATRAKDFEEAEFLAALQEIPQVEPQEKDKLVQV